MSKTGKKEHYRTAVYCRLSDEDYVKRREVSESIENQLAICRDYIASHPELDETGVYLDDGYTGLNYDREGYRRMMADAGQGKIDCIITKSLARLGREHAETIRLFKETFVLQQIRYIAVVDRIDFNGKIESMELPMKVVMNDQYSMETSKNIRSVFAVKAVRGEFIGAFASYGYKKDEKNKNHLVIDPPAAEVVRRIYAEFMAGKTITAIAHGLNENHILCPSEYKKQAGLRYRNNKRLEQTVYWTYGTVKKILLNENENYIGNMVQHRTEKMAYNLPRMTAVPKENWIRAEHTHEPIIEKADYELVQKWLGQRRSGMEHCQLKKALFSGMVFCGECGRCLTRSTRKDGEIFRCSTYARIGKNYCSQHLIYRFELEELVFAAIVNYVSDTLQTMNFQTERQKFLQERDVCFCHTDKNGVPKRAPEYEKDWEEQQKSMEQTYQTMLNYLSQGEIDAKDFQIFKEKYHRKKERLAVQRQEWEAEFLRNQAQKAAYDKWEAAFLRERKFQELSREMLICLIERIDVYADCHINIRFRFRAPEIPSELSHMKTATRNPF